jgi:predicted ATPase
LTAQLGEPGCTTLVGPGGVGKTALARVAYARWPGRSLWIDLADVTDPDQLTSSIARAIGAPISPGQPAQAWAGWGAFSMTQ